MYQIRKRQISRDFFETADEWKPHQWNPFPIIPSAGSELIYLVTLNDKLNYYVLIGMYYPSQEGNLKFTKRRKLLLLFDNLSLNSELSELSKLTRQQKQKFYNIFV